MDETLKPTVTDRIRDARKLLPKICGWQELRDIPPDQVERFLTPMAVLGKGSLGLVDAVVSSARNTIPFVRKRVFLPPSRRTQLLHIAKSEANILEDLVHTHIVHLFGTYEHKPRIGLPTFSLLMFPVGDNDLAGFLYNYTNLDQLLEEARETKHWLRRWFSCLTSALAYIHDQGVRHQDIKPSNIIHQRDHIFFTDFSSSARFDPTSTTSTENPARNSAMYSAPEVLDRVEGSDDYQRHGTRSDVFSLGCVFVEMFAATKGVSVYDLHTSLQTAEPQNGFSYSRMTDTINLYLDGLPSKSHMDLPWDSWTNVSWTELFAPMLREDRKERPAARQILNKLSHAVYSAWPCECVPLYLPGYIPTHADVEEPRRGESSTKPFCRLAFFTTVDLEALSNFWARIKDNTAHGRYAARWLDNLATCRSDCAKWVESLCHRFLSSMKSPYIIWDKADSKPVHRNSVWVAFQRYGVHLLPSTISIVVIFVNVEGYYVGLQQHMVLLQIASKIQELLIVSSLTMVIVYELHDELINSESALFGITGNRKLFNQLVFSGSISAKIRINTGLITLLLASSILAVASGPAFAILLSPSFRNWSAGGSTYWISGTSDDLWPSQVGLEHYMPENGHLSKFSVSCTSKNAYTNSLCPSGGYLQLMRRLTSGWDPWPTPSIAEYFPIIRSDFDIPVYGPYEQEGRYSTESEEQGDAVLESSTFTIHWPAVWVARKLGMDWYNASNSVPRLSTNSQYKVHSTMQSTVWTQLPAVAVQCNPPKFFTQNQREVAFPSLSRSELARELPSGWDLHRVALVDTILDNQTFSAYPRVSNIDLSAEPWTNATTGIVIESPWTNETARTVSLCVVDTHWASGTVSLHSSRAAPSTPHSHSIQFNDHYYLSKDVFAPSAGSEWRRLNTTEEWLHALNFHLPDEIRGLNPSNTTAIEALVIALGIEYESGSAAVAYEHVLGAMYADALARIGSWRIPDIANSNTHRKKDWKSKLLRGEEAFQRPAGAHHNFTGFQTSQSITGYAYHADTGDNLAAIAVLVGYLVIALGFTIRSLVTTWRSRNHFAVTMQ